MSSARKAPKLTITFPNLLLIPILSVVFSVIKLFGGISWNWMETVVVVPLMTYVTWSALFVAIALIAYWTFCRHTKSE